MKGPLSGYKIIEFATYVAAPSGVRILGDWGAEVIKIEAAAGDAYRTNWNVYQTPGESDLYNPCFDVVGVNKRFMALDLKSDEGRKILYKLLEDADVFVTSAREKALKKLSCDWETLHAKFPKLVYGHVRGYGEQGAMRDMPGYDYTAYHARSGVGGSLYEKGGAPMVGGPAFGDLQTGLALSGGIAAALLAAQRTGIGDRVVVSLHAVGVYVMSLAHTASQFGKYVLPTSRRSVSNPFNSTYKTKDDKWIQLCVSAPELEFDHFMETIGREDLKGDPRYCKMDYMRAHHHDEFVDIIEEALAQKTMEEWERVFTEADVAFGPMYESQDVLLDPEVWDNEYAERVTYPTGDEAILIHSPARLDSIGTAPLVTSRGIGADTKAILREHGFSDDQISDWEARGIVTQHK